MGEDQFTWTVNHPSAATALGRQSQELFRHLVFFFCSHHQTQYNLEHFDLCKQPLCVCNVLCYVLLFPSSFALAKNRSKVDGF
jgi:hypothetical protein